MSEYTDEEVLAQMARHSQTPQDVKEELYEWSRVPLALPELPFMLLSMLYSHIKQSEARAGRQRQGAGEVGRFREDALYYDDCSDEEYCSEDDDDRRDEIVDIQEEAEETEIPSVGLGLQQSPVESSESVRYYTVADKISGPVVQRITEVVERVNMEVRAMFESSYARRFDRPATLSSAGSETHTDMVWQWQSAMWRAVKPRVRLASHAGYYLGGFDPDSSDVLAQVVDVLSVAKRCKMKDVLIVDSMSNVVARSLVANGCVVYALKRTGMRIDPCVRLVSESEVPERVLRVRRRLSTEPRVRKRYVDHTRTYEFEQVFRSSAQDAEMTWSYLSNSRSVGLQVFPSASVACGRVVLVKGASSGGVMLTHTELVNRWAMAVVFQELVPYMRIWFYQIDKVKFGYKPEALRRQLLMAIRKPKGRVRVSQRAKGIVSVDREGDNFVIECCKPVKSI